MLWKKKTPRRFYIPEEHMERVIELSDTDDREGTKMSRYRLWMYIADLFPATKETLSGKWTLHDDNALYWYVEGEL